MSHEARRRLAVVDRILLEPDLVAAGAWPRTCTWLIRLALEHALDDFWTARRAEVATANRRAQLLALTRCVDGQVGRQATELWHVLSRAAHHHAYELAPTAAELRSWHGGVRDVVDGLATAAPVVARTPAPSRDSGS